MSLMLRVDIEIQLLDDKTRNVSYMLKIPPMSKEANNLVTAMKAFRKEASTYELLRDFEQLYRDAGKELNIAPKSFKFEKNVDVDTIVLENLKPKGFQNVNRLLGLNEVHAKVVLEKLAVFHAASAVFIEQNGQLADIFTKPLMDAKCHAEFEKKSIPMDRKFWESLRNYGLREYQDKIKLYQENYSQIFRKTEKADPLEFNVLTHGDCWSNNIMFKYDAFGKIVDVIFVDFQLTKYGSPAQDLIYFILSSTQLEDKLKNFDFYVKYYHDHLINNLKLLSYKNKMPKLNELHMAILRNSCWAYTTVAKILPIVLLEPISKTDMNIDGVLFNKSEGFDMLTAMFSTPQYANNVRQIIPWMENRSFLEV